MGKTTLRRLGLALIAGLLAAFVVAPAAIAQDPGDDPSAAQYNPPIPAAESTGSDSAEDTGSAVASSGSGGGGSGLNSNIGSLPFTGMDLLIVAGVAFVLTGTGFALRRLSTPRGPGV